MSILPPKLPKRPKRESRWRSPAHLAFVRSHCCSVCGSDYNIQAAHVRYGSNTGLGQKPDDWRAVSLCAGPNSNNIEQLGCHNRQHIVGEVTFWANSGVNPEELIQAFCDASPKAHEIRRVKAGRESGG